MIGLAAVGEIDFLWRPSDLHWHSRRTGYFGTPNGYLSTVNQYWWTSRGLASRETMR